MFMLVRVAGRVIRADEKRLIANTVCHVLGLTTKKEKSHA